MTGHEVTACIILQKVHSFLLYPPKKTAAPATALFSIKDFHFCNYLSQLKPSTADSSFSKDSTAGQAVITSQRRSSISVMRICSSSIWGEQSVFIDRRHMIYLSGKFMELNAPDLQLLTNIWTIVSACHNIQPFLLKTNSCSLGQAPEFSLDFTPSFF